MELFSLERYTPPPSKVRKFKEEVYENLDQAILFFLCGYFLFGLAIAFRYDSWGLAFGVGLTNFALFFSYFLLKNKPARRFLYSLNLFIYTLQFIVQMEGAFYMHFIFFISLIILSTYGNWRILVPFFIYSVIYYTGSIFQMYSGTKSWGKYFINDQNVVSIEFVTIAVMLGVIQFLLMVYVSNFINKLLYKSAKRSIYLQDQLNIENNIMLAQQVANGNFDSHYDLKDNDQMGAALLEMRKSLKRASENDRKNKWISDGLAHMSDILIASGDVSEICHNVLREIIRYMEIEHGGIFTMNTDGDEDYLELRSFYAFERTDFITKKIKPGENLVGEAAARRKTIHIENVPSSYVSIASGLGKAMPKSILITPLMVKDEVLGVLELASLKKIEPHQLEFVEKVTANISVMLLSANAANQTAKLLQDAQVYNIQMQAQEDAMRANVDALSKTQNELSNQIVAKEVIEQKLSSRMQVIDEMAIVIEIDTEGMFLDVNDGFIDAFGFAKNEVVGEPWYTAVHDKKEFKPAWEKIRNGQNFVGDLRFKNKASKDIWLEFAVSPITESSTKEVVKYLCIGFEITALKVKEKDIERLLDQSKLRNHLLNLKEEEMQNNLKALEIAEDELSEQIQLGIRQQEFYDLILAFVKGVVYRAVKKNNEWVIDYLNPGVFELTGYAPSEFTSMNRSFSSLVYEEDKDFVRKEFERSYADFSLRFRMQRADGEIIWVEEKGKQIYDAYLRANVVIGFLYDVTKDVTNKQSQNHSDSTTEEE